MFTDFRYSACVQYSIPVKPHSRLLITKICHIFIIPQKIRSIPRYNIINQSDESSLLSVRFSANDLFFSEANPQGVPTAMVLITVKLYNMSQGKALADTAVLNLSIFKETGKQEYIYNVPLKVEKGTEYLAEIKILDRLRLLVAQAFVQFNTLSV